MTESAISGANSPLGLHSSQDQVEKHCGVGDQIIIEHQGQRFFTKFRGARGDFVMRAEYNTDKDKLAVVNDTSFFLADYTKKIAASGVGLHSIVQVRFISAGTVFGFRTMVRGIYSYPPLLVFEYPEKYERRNLRASERFNAIFPMDFALDGASIRHSGVVLDLSACGIRLGLKGSGAIPEHGNLSVSFTLPTGKRVVNSAMTAQNVTSEGERQFIGAKFASPPEPSVSEFYEKCMLSLR